MSEKSSYEAIDKGFAVGCLLRMIQDESMKDIPYTDKSAFLGENRQKVREIGEKLYAGFGMEGLHDVFNIIHGVALTAPNEPFYLRDLELAWSGIVDWKG